MCQRFYKMMYFFQVPVDAEGKKLFKTPTSWTNFFGNDPPKEIF